MSGLANWLPPLVWMAAVLWFSSGDFSAQNTGRLLEPVLRWLVPSISAGQVAALHALARTTMHVAEYALLAALWFRAFVRSGRAAPGVAVWAALALSVGCAVLDELHQAMVPTRTGSVGDVGLDTAGALAALVVARWGWRTAADRLTGVLLWAAAAGGIGVVAVDLVAGVSPGVLWVTVPVAAAMLVLRWRKSGSRS